MTHDKPTVRVKPHGYQPNKAELEEPVSYSVSRMVQRPRRRSWPASRSAP